MQITRVMLIVKEYFALQLALSQITQKHLAIIYINEYIQVYRHLQGAVVLLNTNRFVTLAGL